MKHGDRAEAYLQEYEHLQAGRLEGRLTEEEEQRFRELRKLLATDFFERALHEAQTRPKTPAPPPTLSLRARATVAQVEACLATGWLSEAAAMLGHALAELNENSPEDERAAYRQLERRFAQAKLGDNSPMAKIAQLKAGDYVHQEAA